MVPEAGIEPARPFGQRILSPCSVILSNTYISYISLFKGFRVSWLLLQENSKRQHERKFLIINKKTIR